MRGYTSISASELKAWLDDGDISIVNLYAPTENFLTENSELNEEEMEFALSMFAAQDALADESQKFPLVAALEIPAGSFATNSDGLITPIDKAKWDYLECIFLVEDGGEELTWFATQEVSHQLKIWLG